VKLPVLDAGSHACAGCHGPCCLHHEVPISGHDLWRLVRGLSVPWRDLVEVDADTHPLYDGFRLDRSSRYHYFRLRRRAHGACQLLVEIEGGHRRCGVHALRPSPCRLYPLVPALDAPFAEFSGHAQCPPPQAAAYRAAADELLPLVDDESAERMLWARVIDRWELRAMCAAQPIAVDDFVSWLGALYDRVDELRTTERGDWQLAAYALVDQFPLE
jgi:Fe-S-cluster containining protein